MKLFEVAQSNTESQKEFIQRVAKDCQPFLKAKKVEEVVYRGMIQNENVIFNKPVRKNRRSRGTPQIVSDVIDEFFKEKFGIPFRKQGLFVGGEISTADIYGSIYSIYPVGQFNFLWSPKIIDLFSALARNPYQVSLKDFHNGNLTAKMEEFLKYIPEFLSSQEFTTKHLSEAIESNHEIMIDVDSYHAILVGRDINFSEQIDKQVYDVLKGNNQ